MAASDRDDGAAFADARRWRSADTATQQWQRGELSNYDYL
jgi:hypothetical protein